MTQTYKYEKVRLEDKVEIFQKGEQKDQSWENIGHIKYQSRRSNIWLNNIPERENKGEMGREKLLQSWKTPIYTLVLFNSERTCQVTHNEWKTCRYFTVKISNTMDNVPKLVDRKKKIQTQNQNQSPAKELAKTLYNTY